MTRLLVTVAHPDDETFGTGSVIAAAAAAGAEVVVCCATRGEAGEAPDLLPGRDLGAVREAELRAAGSTLGVSRFVLLGYGDSGMSGVAAPGTLAAARVEEVAARITEVITEVKPDIVVTLDPDHGDGHRDHAMIGRATIAAGESWPDLRLYLWVLPRRLLAQWFAEIERRRPDSEHLDLDRSGIGRPDEDITTVLDTTALRPLRERASAMHATQTPPTDGMPEQIRAAFLERDYLIRLRPPWTGGETEQSLF